MVQTYGIRATPVLDRSCQTAFRAAVYLSLREVSVLAGVSIPPVFQIQRKIEAEFNDDRLNALKERYQVKN